MSKVAAGAIDQAGKHASDAGPLTYFWFVVAVLCAGLTVYFYHKADKASTERSKACDEAVATARVEWAKQQAIDNGNWGTQVKELKDERRDLLDRLERINHELRQQEGKSIEVLAGLRQALGHVHQSLAINNQRLEQIATYGTTTTRPSATPFSSFPAIPGLTPDPLLP